MLFYSFQDFIQSFSKKDGNGEKLGLKEGYSLALWSFLETFKAICGRSRPLKNLQVGKKFQSPRRLIFFSD